MSRPLAILIVEDLETDALLITHLLTRAGYAVTAARVETAAELRAALAERTWDAVISDYQLPTLDGRGALAVLQETGLDLPFIVVSGTMGEETAVEMMKAGAHDYVMKDKLARLIPAVEREIQQAQVRRERRQAEEALRKSQEQFRIAQEMSPDGFTILRPVRDTQGQIVDFTWVYENAAVARLNGTDPETVVGQRLLDLFPAHRGTPFLKSYQQVAESGETCIFEADYSGESMPRPTSFRIVVVPMAGDVAILAQDITERKQLEKNLQEYNIRLEAAVEARTRELRAAQAELVRHEKLAVLGQLAGGVGHELRNPLAVINNAVYYLKLVQPDANAKIREYLNLIEREVRNAEKIIGDLLDFARIKSLERESVALAEVVDDVLARFPVPARVRVTVDLPADLPAAYADPRHVTQVLGNLVTNACQAMPEGGELVITGLGAGGRGLGTGERGLGTGEREMGDGGQPSAVGGQPSSVGAQPSAVGGRTVALSVRDTGVGIPPENMDKLFEPLFTTKAKGIGLGLAVSKKLIEANGGRIEVTSAVGQGSTFTIFLPVEKGP